MFTEFLHDWFITEKLKQRGSERNLYGDWIILLKEQLWFRSTGFLDLSIVWNSKY
jgi:hypothetical protein